MDSEKPLVFVAVVLQAATGVKRSKDIHAKLDGRMDLWICGKIPKLIADLEAEVRLQGGPSEAPTEEEQFRAFNA